MKFHVVIENKNTNDLLRWINGMVVGRVFTMTFLLVSQNFGQKMLFLLLLHRLRQQHAPPTKKKKNKTKEKIEILLEHVVRNSWAFFASFQESTAILKNMDKNFDALIAKL